MVNIVAQEDVAFQLHPLRVRLKIVLRTNRVTSVRPIVHGFHIYSVPSMLAVVTQLVALIWAVDARPSQGARFRVIRQRVPIGVI